MFKTQVTMVKMISIYVKDILAWKWQGQWVSALLWIWCEKLANTFYTMVPDKGEEEGQNKSVQPSTTPEKKLIYEVFELMKTHMFFSKLANFDTNASTMFSRLLRIVLYVRNIKRKKEVTKLSDETLWICSIWSIIFTTLQCWETVATVTVTLWFEMKGYR